MSARLVRLGDVAEFVRGVTYKPGDVTTADDPQSIPCLRTKNIQDYLEDDDLVYIPRHNIKSSKIVQEGDIIVSSANSWNLVGKCSWIPRLDYDATFGGFTSVLRGNELVVCRRYLYHWFSSPTVQQLARSFGNQTTNISNLNQARCLELEIPLPPLEEQKRIATILDKADALRAKRRHAIALLDSLTQSIFMEMFGDPVSNPKGWPVKELQDIVDAERKVTYGILMPGPHLPDGIPYVRVVDIQGGVVLTHQLRRTTKEIAIEYRRSALKAGDLLISIRGHVGRLAIAPLECDGANITQDTARLAVTGANPHFVSAVLAAEASQHWMDRRTKGVAVRGINLGDLKRFPVILPPSDLQCQFAAKVGRQEKLMKQTSRQISETESLFASLQHLAFTGQL